MVLAVGLAGALVWSLVDDVSARRSVSDGLRTRSVVVALSHGKVWFIQKRVDDPDPSGPRAETVSWMVRTGEDERRWSWQGEFPPRPGGGDALWSGLGVEWAWVERRGYSGRRGWGTGGALGVPLWMGVVGTGAAAWWLLAGVGRAWLRVRRGACAACGYPRCGEVCPECGGRQEKVKAVES